MIAKKRHPIARVRAAFAGVDLFFPMQSGFRKRLKVKKFLRRIRSDSKISQELESRGASGSVDKRGVLRRQLVFLNERFGKDKQTIVHELAHFFRVGKNDLLTSNAVNGYFSRKRGTFFPEEGYKSFLEDAEEIVRKGKMYSADRFEHDPDSDLGHRGDSIDIIGMHFGSFAAEREKAWKKPASGLFLIREVSNGKPVAKAIEEIRSGRFDSEIRLFARKHLANLLSVKR